MLKSSISTGAAAQLRRAPLLYSRTLVFTSPNTALSLAIRTPITRCEADRRSFTSGASQHSVLTDRSVHPTSIFLCATEDSATAAHATAITQPDAVSTVPTMARGDWVLFHPVYTPEELRAVEVLHREAKTFSDKLAYGMVKLARTMFDLVSRYKHVHIEPDEKMTVRQLRDRGLLLDDRAWLNFNDYYGANRPLIQRILFLESIAGVPGMVAATLRHLTSLRLMVSTCAILGMLFSIEETISAGIVDGWVYCFICELKLTDYCRIHTCLEEAENERMHLMTFMTLRKPSWFFRSLVLGAQGVFYNLFFLSYMVSPKTCHRFVGYLEEEAVLTYTKCIQDLEAGRIPEWTNEPAPGIAIDYWRLPPDAKLLDVLYAVRSDETTHRFVNHSLANLNPSTDVNPFALREPDMHIKGKKTAFDRDEAEHYVKESHALMEKSYFAQEADEPLFAPRHYDNHRRVFIGPMPEKVIEKKQAEQGISQSNSHGDEYRDDISEVIKRNAFSFFIRQGGRPEDWDEDEERNVVEEMFRRWRDSEWSRIWRRRREKKVVVQTSYWVGNSFEIGQFLGVNVLKDNEATRDIISMVSSSVRKVPLHSIRTSQDLPRASSSIGHETFVTASTGFHLDNTTSDSERGVSFDVGRSLYASSSTSLLRPSQNSAHGLKARTMEIASPCPALVDSPPTKIRSDDAIAAGRKGKGKLVHYVEPVQEEEPAPPQEVLERTEPESLINTSAEAAANLSPVVGSPTNSSASLGWGDAIMRGNLALLVTRRKI
ncbi:hypothetical protein C0995_003215 [Termitomyces sp. Mi166|nr:hypothetical protein C0995_003215 [Termitomyces sp. Mi166\